MLPVAFILNSPSMAQLSHGGRGASTTIQYSFEKMRTTGAHKVSCRRFADADVRVKPITTQPAINTDASKHKNELISKVVQDMFEEAELRLDESDS